MSTDSKYAHKFIQARHYHHGRLKKVRLCVIHDMEYPEKSEAAEWCAGYFASPGAPLASCHYAIDNNSAVQGVKESDTAWAAPGANADGLQFECAGYASQSARDWRDAYSTALLERAARLVADACQRHNIPIRHLTPAQVRDGHAGICGHWDVTKAYPDRNSHTDPGPGFPWDRFIGRVEHYAGGGHAPKPKPSHDAGRPVLSLGDHGSAVRELQRFMMRVFPSYAGPIAKSGGADGSYGYHTRAVMREFQRRAKRDGVYHDAVDGITGPHTWEALDHYGYDK